MEIPAQAWKQLYPALFSQLLVAGVPEGFGAAKAEVERELTSEEVLHAQRALFEYLQRIVAHEDVLSTESYYLVLQLAEEACVIEGMGMIGSDELRSGIVAALKAALDSRQQWLVEDMRTDRRAPFSDLWPFTELLQG